MHDADQCLTERSVGKFQFVLLFSGCRYSRLQVQDVETGLISNTILLQLEAPPEILDAPAVSGYLYLDKAEIIKQGRLSANRLGGAPIPQFAFTAPRY